MSRPALTAPRQQTGGLGGQGGPAVGDRVGLGRLDLPSGRPGTGAVACPAWWGLV